MLGELRYAFRKLRANPGFTLVAVLMLAVAIGAGTAVFSVVNAALLRPLAAVADPERLIALTRVQGADRFGNFGYPDYVDYRDRNSTLTGLAAHCRAPLVFSNGAAECAPVRASIHSSPAQ